MNGPLLFLFLLCVHSLTIYIINVYIKRNQLISFDSPPKKSTVSVMFTLTHCCLAAAHALFGPLETYLPQYGKYMTPLKAAVCLPSIALLMALLSVIGVQTLFTYWMTVRVHILDPKEESLLTECV